MSIPETDGLILRSDLPERLRLRLREKENYMGMKCRRLWTFTNPKGERFVFGKFTAGRDNVIVTVSRYEPGVGWIWPP